MPKNNIDFDFCEKSLIEKIKFSGEQPKNFSIIAHNKNYIKNILENHKAFQAKRKIYSILKQLNYEKNPGVALEYFLIEYLKDSIKLEKKDPQKWEANKIDFFYKNLLGIQLTITSKICKKETQLLKLKHKISNNELYYINKINKNDKKINIPNSEIPKYIALISIDNEIIKKLVNNKKHNFLKQINSLSDKNFIELINILEIIKKSLNQIIEKINFLKKKKKNYQTLIPNQQVNFLMTITKEQNYNNILNKYLNNEISYKPTDILTNSNIDYLYNPTNQKIIFTIYKTKEKQEKIYTFILYL